MRWDPPADARLLYSLGGSALNPALQYGVSFNAKDQHPLQKARMSRAEQLWFQYMQFYLHRLPLPAAVLLATALVPIALLGAILFLVSWSSPFFWLGLMLLARTGFIFFFAPSGLFKYITSSWFLGWWIWCFHKSFRLQK
jgi:hypothetical protein